MTNSLTNRWPGDKAFQTLTDAQLYGLCKEYGARVLEARRKFIGLLPEVFKRQLHSKKGFGSIEEFAAKLCGVSRKQVQRVLNLEERFADKPALKLVLTSGEVSVNKLARVASIATSENQEELAVLAKKLPQRALETLARDGRIHSALSAKEGVGENKNANGLGKPLFEVESVCAHTLQLDEDVRYELQELQEKGIDVSALIRQMLGKRRADLAAKKAKLAAQTGKLSRYIPAKIRHLLRNEHGDKCSIRTCGKRAVTIHHTQRYALSRNHDPNFLAPLCREHHSIAHSIDGMFWERRRAPT